MSWEEVLIGDNCEVLSAKRIFAKDYVAAGIPFYRSKEIIYKALNQFKNDDVFIKEERFNEIKNKFGAPKRGDVLISSVGNRSGISYWVKEDYDFYFKDGNLIWFRNFNDKMSSKYLVYYLNSKLGQAKINNMFIGAAQKALTIEGVKRISLRLPPPETQKQIADIISAYDDLIENNLKRIKLLEQAAQNIYKEWFVNMRFPGHENTPVDQETGLPEGWGYGLVSDLCEVKSGYAFKSKQWKKEGNPVIKIKNINNNTVSLNDTGFVADEVAQNAKKYELFSGDVIIAMTGATVGKVGLVPKIDKRIYLNQRVGLFRPLSDENNNIALVFSFFLTDDSQQQVLNFAQGAAQPNISGSEIGNIKLNIADSKVLKLFNKMIKPSLDLIQSLYGQNQKLKAAREILLPRLMNRTIEV